jgi:molybdopterin-biosynthesis enzyme MoeA-like protein
VQGLFRGPLSKSSTVYTKLGEGVIADAVRELATLHPGVRIGSYPDTGFDTKDAASYRVKLQLDSRDDAALAAARSALEDALLSLK